MRAKTINEIGFERYKDPKEALGLSIDFKPIEKFITIQEKFACEDFVIVKSKLNENTQFSNLSIVDFCEEHPNVIIYAFWNTPHQSVYTAAFTGKSQIFKT